MVHQILFFFQFEDQTLVGFFFTNFTTDYLIDLDTHMCVANKMGRNMFS